MLRFVLRRKLATAVLIAMTVLAAVAATGATGAIPAGSGAAGPAAVTDTCGYNPNSAPKPGGGTVTFSENIVTRAIQFFGVGASGHVGVFTQDETGLLIGNGGTPSYSVGSTIGTLGAAIANGSPVSSIPVAAPGLTVAVSAGDLVVLGSGGSTETFKANAAAPAGATSISVSKKTATQAFAAGDNVADRTLDWGEAVPPTFGSGADLEGRALAPQIYLTDITSNPSANGGDYEQGGTAANAGPPPFADALYGSWSPTVGQNPVNRNHWDLGPHADPIPAAALVGPADENGFGAEVVWKVGGLQAFDPSANGGAGGYAGLQPGHTYRVQSITHDTDQNVRGGGGDVGEVCTTFAVPTAASPSVSITKTADHSTPVHAGDRIGFKVEVKNTGAADATGVALNDPLPAGSGSGVTWSIDPSVGTPSRFALSGAPGHQMLSLASGTLPAGADYTVHVTAATSETECGSYDNTATLTTGNANNPSPVSASESCAYRVDLSITKTGSPSSQTLGAGNITWTMVVTNNGPDTDTGVTIADPMPAGNTYVSASTTQGTCTGGTILDCSLGTMAAGAKVTITLVTTPSTVGKQVNTVTVAGGRPETDTGNNTATATVRTVGVHQPPVFCVAVSKVSPRQLFVGRKTTLTIHVREHGRPVKGVHVRIKGPKINVRTGASNRKGVIKRRVNLRKAGIMIFSPIAGKRCNTRRVGVTNVFTPPVTG